MRSSALQTFATLLLLALAAPAAAQDHAHEATLQDVGSVSFPTSCSPEAQPKFERAVAMLHSFWFDAALEAFRDVAATDPGCAMAHWGEAMTLWGNPMTRSAPSAERTERALEAIRKAEALFAETTPRERGYVEAAAMLFRDHERLGHLERMRLHEEAMREVVEANPDDPEAAIFHGRIMVANAPPDDTTFSRQETALQLLNPLFEERPRHPGLAHYIIHASDAPPIADRGLEAARSYADIAPAAAHALHMPSHIFTRLGLWDESIATNSRSAAAEPNPRAAVHPLDYMVYAYLQQGRHDAAREVVGNLVDAETDRFYGGLLGYNAAAMRARPALEGGHWEEAATLPVPEGAAPYVEAVTRFARAIGAARIGDAAAAGLEADRLGELAETLEARGDREWAARVGAQTLAAAAWAARADAKDDRAVGLATRAAELEESVQKHPVTPGPLLPARELLGDLLLDLGRPAEAQAAYEATLRLEPRRARSLYGAARAAELAGNADAAAKHYAELLELFEHADPDRPEPERARAFLADSR